MVFEKMCVLYNISLNHDNILGEEISPPKN